MVPLDPFSFLRNGSSYETVSLEEAQVSQPLRSGVEHLLRYARKGGGGGHVEELVREALRRTVNQIRAQGLSTQCKRRQGIQQHKQLGLGHNQSGRTWPGGKD
jgi:hypothetical protein